MTRLQDENSMRNRNILFAVKSLFSGRAFVLLGAVFAMLLPFTFSPRSLSSSNESIAKPETINPTTLAESISPTTFAEPVGQTIFAEVHPQALSSEDHYAQIPYFTESEGTSSILTLNNNMPDFMQATVTLFNEQGDSFVVPPIALPPMNAARFSLKELTKDAKGNFTSGSVEVFYHGPSMAVTSQVSIISASKGLSFESSETSAMGFASNKLDAIAWLPDGQAQANVAITNTTGNAVNVTVTASQEQGNNSKSMTLKAREMRLVDLNELITSQSDTSITATVSVEHNGMPGAVIATGFALNEQKGFFQQHLVC
jgi:hypothetical protein